MKIIELTEKELTTLLWAVHNQATAETIKLVRDGKVPQQDETVQRLNAISKKAYTALTADAK